MTKNSQSFLFRLAHVTLFVVCICIASDVSAQRHKEEGRYAGATGEAITAFDVTTDLWLEEMDSETIEVTLQNLTGAAEYFTGWLDSSGGIFIPTEEGREETSHQKDFRAILSNRRFRKAYEDLQKIDRAKAAQLLSENIRINLAELRKMFQDDLTAVSKGTHREITGVVISVPDLDSYRSNKSRSDSPTRLGRKYAVLSYIWIAALLELREVRPAVEEVIQFAKEEFGLFNRLKSDEDVGFKQLFYGHSLYSPSLLLTATLCDPMWNVEKRKSIKSKLRKVEIVDYQARSLEYDMPGREGWVPVVPHNQMLEIRYYKGITDKEFESFFGTR